MKETKNKLEEKFENWIEWKLYKILYIGILVPLLFSEARKWLFQDFGVALIFCATAIILLLPAISKGLDILNLIEGVSSSE